MVDTKGKQVLTGKRARLPDLARLLGRVQKKIRWLRRPAEADMPLCDPVVRAFLNCSGDLERIGETVPGCSAEKFTYRKLILRHEGPTHQTFFKFLTPHFSWRWREGLKVFKLPALREAEWFDCLTELGVNVVELVGVGTSQWINRATPAQNISYIVTRTPLAVRRIIDLLDEGLLSARQRQLAAGEVRRCAELLHENGIGRRHVLQWTNVLFNPDTEEVILCDLERTRRLGPLFTRHALEGEAKSIRRTLQLLEKDGRPPEEACHAAAGDISPEPQTGNRDDKDGAARDGQETARRVATDA
jgi:hypothetical protein